MEKTSKIIFQSLYVELGKENIQNKKAAICRFCSQQQQYLSYDGPAFDLTLNNKNNNTNKKDIYNKTTLMGCNSIEINLVDFKKLLKTQYY